MINGENGKVVARRTEILGSAMHVFGEKGYAVATMDEVAAQAGISKGSIYNYFKNKEDLFAQLFMEIVAEDERMTDAIVDRDSPAAEKLQDLLRLWFTRFDQYQTIGRLILEYWSTAAGQTPDGHFAMTFRDMYSRYAQRLTAILSQGEREGQFTLLYGADVGAQLIMAVTDGIGLHMMLGIRKELNEEYLAALSRAIFDAMKADVVVEPKENKGYES